MVRKNIYHPVWSHQVTVLINQPLKVQYLVEYNLCKERLVKMT